MNSELAHQVQEVVEHSSMDEVFRCVQWIELKSEVSVVSIAFNHGITYIIDGVKGIGYLSSSI